MTTADAVVETLVANGTRTMFGLPGAQLDHFTDAIARNGKIRFIHTRHEQGAAYMALGAALATGEPAVYAVVPGPGFLNSTGALCTAYACGAPVLAITGQIPSALIGRGNGILHELPDQLAVLKLLTKWADRIHDPYEAPQKVAHAFSEMRTGRPRPVALECALDVFPRSGDATIPPVQPTRTIPVDDEKLRAAAKLLGKAQRPVIVVGGGALAAGAEILALAEMLQAPVISHRMGRGVVSERNPLSVSIDVGYELWSETDAVVAIGTRLQLQLAEWGTAGIPIVRIDIDPDEPARVKAPEIAIQADAAIAVRALVDELAHHNIRRESRASEMTARRAASMQRLAVLAPQLQYIAAIRAELPDDGIYVDEVTQVGHVTRLEFPTYQPRTYLTNAYQGTLGWGLGTALGAKVAMPDRAVVSVNGDGGFLFGVQELATAVQHNIGVTFIVFNDNAFGNVRRTQTELFAGRYIASDLRNPNFVQLAQSFGMPGTRVSTPAELRVQLREAIASSGSSLIEVTVGEMPPPWALLRRKPIQRASHVS